MNILGGELLEQCWSHHPEVRGPLAYFRERVMAANWGTPAELASDFPRASILRGNRVAFRVKGNEYRVVAEVSYVDQEILFRFAGTHAEYDRVNAEEV